jgi:hypothetical protein
MLNIIPRHGNGSGSNAVSGRGLLRRKLTPEQKIGLAADLATGQYKFEPSLLQLSDLFDVPVHHLRDELKRRSVALDDAAAERWAVQCEAEAIDAEADALAAVWNGAPSDVQYAAVQIICSRPIVAD